MGRRVLELAPSSFKADAFANAVRLLGRLTAPLGHRGFWHATALLGRFVDRECDCTIAISDESAFSFRCGDPYWARMLSPAYDYEPELYELRGRLCGRDYVFLDCGANLGFWSLLFSERGHARTVVAVEAMPATFERLDANSRRNGNRFAVLHRAVYSRVGESVRIGQSGDNHAGAGIAEIGTPVETISIDALAETHNPAKLPLIVKLDVEGAEVDAFQGAANAMKRAFVAIYEDHGNDPDSRVTAFVLRELGLAVLFLGADGRYVRIQTAEHASSFKKKASVGYNFFAVTDDMLPLFGHG
jgi:FkbM family methyltransferase